MSESIVTCTSVSKWFGPRKVLDEVEMEVPRRSFVSVLGPSGCGKTTLLRAIAGLLPVDSGTITIDGERVTGPSKSLAVVFQNFGLLPWKTVEGNIVFALHARGISRKEARARTATFIKMVGLSGCEKLYPYQISGGMQQRAGIARALAVNPQLLLMDEPFASVDAQTRESLHNELLTLWEQERKSVIFVTHSIDEAIVLSDLILVMTTHPARIVRRIPVELARPRSEETVREWPGFGEIRKEIHRVLRQEVTA